MDEDARLAKNETIKTKGKATRERHSRMRPLTVELKLSLKCLNKKERSKLFSYFTQCRWLCNHLLSLPKEEFKSFDTKTRDITSLDKDSNVIKRHLDLPAKIIQDVKSCLVNDMKALASKRSKTGKANGKLKFRSQYNSILLSQYNNTHRIVNGSDGNRNGKYKNTVHIAGIKRPIRVFGMEQIPINAEFSCAKLVKRPSGIFLLLTCFIPNNGIIPNIDDADVDNAIGIDFGIKAAITTSEGEKFDISIRESKRLVGLQRKFARQTKGSRGWYSTKHLIQREYERIANKRRDKANKTYHALITHHSLIVMQNENIKGWHKGLFGKQVQNSALGTIKNKLMHNPKVVVIDRYFPSTKMCPICGAIKDDITLSDRIYCCNHCGYTEDRDTKAAKTLLLAGRHLISRSCVERTSTPVERMSDFDTQFELWKRSSNKREAGSLSLSSC